VPNVTGEICADLREKNCDGKIEGKTKIFSILGAQKSVKMVKCCRCEGSLSRNVSEFV
jgi:hypothetical protein